MSGFPDPDAAVPAEEREAVLAEARALRDRPPPGDAGSGGCALAIVCLVTVVLMPFIGRALDLSGSLMAVLGGTLALVALGAGLWGIFGGGSARRAVEREAAGALDELEAAHAAGDVERARSAAVRMLLAAHATVGSKTISTLEPDEIRRRLGGATTYVERVERILLGAGEIYPVLNGPDAGAEDRPADEGPGAPGA